MLYTAAVHPPRRVLLFVGVTGLALALPLFYAEEQTFAEEFGRFVLWSGLAIAATAYTAKVRIDRHVLLTSSGEAHSEARVDSLTGLGNPRVPTTRVSQPPRSAPAAPAATSAWSSPTSIPSS